MPRTTDDWDTHWNAHAAMNALNPAQTYRQKLLLGALALRSAKAPPRLIELGSGSGEFARVVLAERNDTEFVGLDLSHVGVELSRKKVPRATFFQQDFAEPIALDDRYRGWATHAVCSEAIEHLDDPVSMLRNARPFFSPGCRLVVTVPAGPMAAFDRHIGHRRHYSPIALRRTLEEAGLRVDDLRGAGFPFFNLYRLTVIARGKRLIADVADQDATTLSFGARAAIRTFSLLFHFNTSKTTLGWQLISVAVEPAHAGALESVAS
ncbi:MAG: class I SAM-dependent methyltransferase [Polyangiaceae bacterium]|jgi:SAM-dependent methyltransferase